MASARERKKASAPRRSALVVGAAMIDTVALIAPEDVERVETRNLGVSYLLIEEGRKVVAQAIERHVGGGGCNSAICLARRGWNTAMVGKTGRDAAAEQVRARLAAERVHLGSLHAMEEEPTGSAVLVASHERNAAAFINLGANGALKPTDFNDSDFAGRDLVYIAPLSASAADCFAHLVEQGRWADAFVAANPGLRQLNGRTDAFFSAIGNMTLITLDRREACALAGALLSRGRLAPSEPSAADENAPLLLRRGLACDGRRVGLSEFCATLRGLGAVWVSVNGGAEGAYLAGPGVGEAGALLYCPSVSVETASTAGAGDAYGATLASELAQGAEPADAMRRAAANAASVLGAVNTTDGLLDAKRLLAAAAEAPTPRPVAELVR